MENMNKQGKTEEQVRSSQLLTFIGFIGIMIILGVAIMFNGCATKTHVITEWDGDREIRWYSTNEE